MANLSVTGPISFDSLSTTAKSVLLDFIYPVGSYVYFNDNFDTVEKVEAHYGGTWVKLDDGYFVEAGSSITTHSAGLPNITGSAKEMLFRKDGVSTSGALSVSENYEYWDSNIGGSYQGRRVKVSFNANKSNSIYGNSDTVQPKSRTAYVYYRTA